MAMKAQSEPNARNPVIEQLPMDVDKDDAMLRAQAQANTDTEHSMSLRDAIRFYPKAVLYCVILSMAIIMEGYQVGLVPSLFAQPAFQQKYGRTHPDGSHQLDNRYQSALTAAVQAGSILGYWLSGMLIEIVGYKRTMQIALLSITCFIFIIFFAPSIILLVVGEGLLGIPWGIIQTLTTTYAAEVSPVALRAYSTSYVNLCWTIGAFISTGVLRGTVDRLDQWAYRIPFALQWIWPVPIIIGVGFAPESPWWLVRKNRIEDARKALMSLTSVKDMEHDIDSVLAMIRHTISQEEHVDQGARYWDCFQGVSLRRTEITCVAGAVPFLAGTGFTSQAIYFLSVAGLRSDAAYSLGLGQNALSFIGVLTSWALMHRFGRRTLYLWGLTITCIILLLVGILGSVPSGTNKGPIWATGALMMTYMFVYNACLGPVAYAVVGETPSSRHRNKTVAIARIFLNLFNFGGSWLNPAIINPTAWGLAGKGGYIWCGVAFATLVWTFFRFPEMKGRTYGEIHPAYSVLRDSLRRVADHLEHDADCYLVYFLSVTNYRFLNFSRLLSRASSRKRRCTYIPSQNTCKECISKDVKCSLSELSSNTTDKQRAARRALLPLQQSSSVLHELHEGPVSSPLSVYDAPTHEVCTELVALYLDLIHDKQHILFHPPTFIAQYHAGQVPEFLVWGMAALASRFSNHACFASIPRGERGRRWLDKALHSFHNRTDDICIAALQGTILLGMACFAEGEMAKEDLLSAQAIRMVQVMQLPDKRCLGTISFEIQVRLYWQVWMMDMWQASRAQYPRQLRADANIPRIMEEKVFYQLQDEPSANSAQLDSAPSLKANRSGLWSTMLPLSEIHSRIMHLNYVLCNQNKDQESPAKVEELAEALLSWHRALPEELHYLPTNIARVKEDGLFRQFNVLHILYHFQFQLLYYQYLQNDPNLESMSAAAKERETYAAQCKAHAIAMSEIFWAANSQKGTECFWSPVNGHLLVVASSVHLHTLLFDTSAERTTMTKKLLEQNFTMLLQLQEYWPSLEHSMMRLRAFHKACLLNAEPSESFHMDDWTAQFLNRYHMPVEDRQSTTTPEEKFFGWDSITLQSLNQ
ncbi:sugar porter family MFS transporter [Stagonosporopsis vannaccii]|nr:sugar porter family MFS transporter [Stagonosporopsis vannaccii]